jgi:predicted metal-dependent hydrolase
LAQVAPALAEGRMGERLLRKYPQAHGHRSDTALYDYVMALKAQFMRSAPPLSKVIWDNKLHVVRNALGTHTTVSRVQGGKLKAKREIRIATVFRAAPEAFLRMISVHELAHIKEADHGKAFYQLCTWMEPEYHQIEFDLRLYLAHRDLHGALDWK